MNGTELRSLSHYQIFDLDRTPGLILEFFFIHCKTVKVSQNDQIRVST